MIFFFVSKSSRLDIYLPIKSLQRGRKLYGSIMDFQCPRPPTLGRISGLNLSNKRPFCIAIKYKTRNASIRLLPANRIIILMFSKYAEEILLWIPLSDIWRLSYMYKWYHYIRKCFIKSSYVDIYMKICR